jgi:hypothetical protein
MFLNLFAFLKFALYEEIEFTQMICLYVTRVATVKGDFSCEGLSLFFYVIM